MKRLCCLVIILVGLMTNAHAAKRHEIWWEKCLGEEVSYQTFYDWIGCENTEIRIFVREYVATRKFKSFLDIPCGLCVDFWNLNIAEIDIDYLGIDITPKLVDRAKIMEIPVMQGTVEAIPLEDSQYEISFSRHLLEHLDYYEQAVDELIRVSKKEVMIVFFIEPHERGDDEPSLGMYNGYPLYHNAYSRPKLEKYILQNPKVKSIEWKHVNSENTVLIIKLKEE